MLQLKNTTPFRPEISVFPDTDAIDTLYIVVTATFRLFPALAVSERPLRPVKADEYFGEPGEASLKAASDLHTGKASSDVILMGQAWAPDGRAVPECAVMVRVAERKKLVRVFGERSWKIAGGFGSPEPFTSMPLVYERAFGGQYRSSDGRLHAEELNPVGRGFLGDRPGSELVGQKLPNLEHPERLLERIGDRAPPACFGYVAPAWLPRRAFAGTYDEAWQKRRAPYLPRDFDPRFFNQACPELTFDRFLSGGEPVEVLGASPHGPIRFELPRCRPTARVRIAGSVESPLFRLETLLIEPDEERVALTYRAALRCDKNALRIREIAIGVAGPVPGASS